MRPVFSVVSEALVWGYNVAAVFPSRVWVVDDWLQTEAQDLSEVKKMEENQKKADRDNELSTHWEWN